MDEHSIYTSKVTPSPIFLLQNWSYFSLVFCKLEVTRIHFHPMKVYFYTKVPRSFFKSKVGRHLMTCVKGTLKLPLDKVVRKDFLSPRKFLGVLFFVMVDWLIQSCCKNIWRNVINVTL